MDLFPTPSGPMPRPCPELSSSSVLDETLEELSAKSNLDMFRNFFDMKNEYWNSFRDRLHQFVVTNYSWGVIIKDVQQRRACAEQFLKQVGVEYWGTPENRQKYLEEKSIRNGHVCIWPDHRRPLAEALVFLLEKRAKTRRDSAITQEVSFPNLFPNVRVLIPISLLQARAVLMKHHKQDRSSQQDMAQTPGDTLTDTEANATSSSTMQNTSTQRPPSPIRMMGTGAPPRFPNNMSTTAASPHVPNNQSPMSTGIRPKAEAQSLSSFHAFGRPERNEEGPSAASVPFNFQGVLQTSPFIGGMSDQSPINNEHRQSTYFLIRTAHHDQPEPVYAAFTHYSSASALLDALANKIYEADEVEKQLHRENPGLQCPRAISAVVCLRWSGVSFMIRRGTNDLQAILHRVECAWKAKEQGHLDELEFVIDVTLNMERL